MRYDPLRLTSPRRREFAFRRVPVGLVVVPITHHLIQAAAVHAAHLLARLLDKMPEQRGARRKRHVIDIAVQGLVHSKDERRHAASPRPTFSRMASAVVTRK